MAEMIQVDLGGADDAAPPLGLVSESTDTDETDADDKPDKADRPERPKKKLLGGAKVETRSSSASSEDLEARRPSRPQSKELHEVKVKEDATLRDIVNSIGTEGSYKITVTRVEPEQFRDPVTRQMVQVGGFLKNYHTPVDEEIIQTNHGGGKFRCRFFRKSQTNSWVFFTERTVVCVGDPRLDDTFRNVAPVNAPAPAERPSSSGESPQLVTKAFDILTSQLDHARNASSQRDDHHRPTIDLGAQAMMKVFEQQLSALNAQNAELAKQLAEARNQKPAEDPWKNSMLDNFFKDDSSRLQATRAQYESEIRTIKENHRIDLEIARSNFERDRTELKQMHERELALTRQTHEVQFGAAKGSFETNMKLAEHENRRLERENAELKSEVKELRALKQKGPLEIIKEAEQIKDALGAGDEGETSKFDQVVNALPSVIEAAKSYMKPPAQQQQQAPEQQALQTKRKIVQTPSGEKFMVDAAGTLTPVKKKPPAPPQPGPNGEPPIPVIKQEVLDNMINYLERAYAGNQDPEVVAQSGKAMVPEEIITAIRDHSVDGFLTKVAKLPSTSPLSNQAGKNWMRKVGKALVGE